jgi:cation transport regulator ChaC
VSDERIWYFAYGSNMETATFRGRRGIAYLHALPARAAGWRLTLDKPPVMPIGESTANIVPDSDAEVLGVLYEITPADWEHVALTEGVRIGNYRSVTLRAVSLAAPALEVDALSLASERRDPALRPSLRYMACLIAGALEHGLPGEWVAMLRAVPARPETPEAVAFRPLLNEVLKRR